MCVHLFGKLNSLSEANYTLKKTAIDHKSKYNHDVIDEVHKNLYIKDYLGSYRNTDLSRETAAKLLLEGRFRLTKLISNSNSYLKFYRSQK